ncbi:hypothetical protein [Peptacetobacter sp.]|uniref:hypothetical protein n=1 Tax=Peptacetobacter sp. TaxID=2991975 RepID=UPI002624104C|nr:hypothetical protein [Peptacetobacter sp.]
MLKLKEKSDKESIASNNPKNKKFDDTTSFIYLFNNKNKNTKNSPNKSKIAFIS